MSNISSCRFCQHYVPEGRRGGNCLKLHAPVQADWSACPLVNDPFSVGWDDSVPLISSLVHHHTAKRYESSAQPDVPDEVVTLPFV
jgi:hypothetical protein